MALDFGILQPANISGQLQAGQESAMRNQLAQQQLASGRTEQEMSQMKLSELRRNTAALESMQRKFLENGKSDDMDANYDAMISSGIPHFMDIGIKAKQTLAQTRIDYATMGLPMPSYLQPKGQGAATGAPAPGAPAPAQGSVSKPFTPEQVLEEERRWAQMAMGGSTKGLAPMLDSKGNLLNPMTPERRALDEQRLQQMADGTAGMAMPAVTGRPIQPEQALNVVSRSEGSPSPIPTANMLAPAAAPATNMLAPAAAPAAPVNALAAPGMSAEEQRARTMLLSQNPGVRAAGQTELNRLTATSDEIRTMKALGIPTTPEGFKQYKALSQTTPQIKEIGVAMGTNKPVYFDTRTEQQFTVGIDPASNKQIRLPYVGGVDRSTSNIKVSATASTEKTYGEQLAGKLATRDDAKLGAAEKAPELATSANRIIDLVSQGNLFTGPVADVKLNIARALNVVGANNDEKIANTEALIAATGQSTLDAIKGAGLGTGQGFTDKDLRFLQGVAGGTITYTPKTLTELATLQHRVATRSVQAWNTRFKELPKSSAEGLGLTSKPDVPPLSSGAKAVAARPAGVGTDWTFENDAAGNKAWVSPDRKSFKEVQ
jgi:hypothetical protein